MWLALFIAVHSFDEAIDRFRQQLRKVESLETREHLVIALYEAGRKAEARLEYSSLRQRYPQHRFNPLAVLPETIAELEPPPASAPASAPIAIKAAPPQRPWHWYYLAPLGIGQFLAHSPVRGSLLLAAEVACIAANVAGAVLLQRELRPDGLVRNLAAGVRGQVVMDIGFFGLLAALAAGIVDGALFER